MLYRAAELDSKQLCFMKRMITLSKYSAAMYSAASTAFSCWLAERCVEVGKEWNDLAPCVERPLGVAGAANREQQGCYRFTLYICIKG